MSGPRHIPKEQVDQALDAAVGTLFGSVIVTNEVPYSSARRTAARMLANALDLIDRPLADAFREESRRVQS